MTSRVVDGDIITDCNPGRTRMYGTGTLPVLENGITLEIDSDSWSYTSAYAIACLIKHAFVAQADETLTAFVELQRAIHGFAAE